MTRRELQVGDEATGTCSKWVSIGRGYGFIAVPGAKDIFVPSRNLANAMELRVGDHVSFEVRMGYDGRLMADNVRVFDIGRAESAG